MNRNVVAFLLIVVLGCLGLVGYRFALKYWDEKSKWSTSDSREIKGTITIGVDSWVGYQPLCGAEMQKRLRGMDWRLKCEDDNADYASRMKKLSRGELDFAVATVDSYLLNGAGEDFPGVIVLVIDESKGGDAIVARRDKIASIEDLKNKPGYKVAYTPASPSEHLLKSVAVHFEVTPLKDKAAPSWKVETGGSAEALQKLEKGEVDVAVLWEPDVSKALADKRFVKILGTEDTQKLVVDILLVGRRFLADNPDMVKAVLGNYFRVLKVYRDNPNLLTAEIKSKVNLSDEQVASMLKGVAFMNLFDNAANWFGVGHAGGLGSEGLTEAIEDTVQILIDHGDFSSSPLPDQDPYRIQNRGFVKELYEQGVSNQFGAPVPDANSQVSADSLAGAFAALEDGEWDALREIGTLKIRPITFQSGTDELDLNGKGELDKAATNLRHYPNFRVVIRGHTANKGDEDANKTLSLNRADAVKRYLEITYGIDSNRLRSIGLGGNAPLPRLPGESDRAYGYRLPRVELTLVSEVY